LFDETTANDSTSTSTVVTDAEPTTELQPVPTEQAVAASEEAHPALSTDDKPAAASDDKHAATEDFAAALETFTTEAEEAVSDDRVIKGTVLKLTPTHVVVDVGAKSEGMLAIAEVLDHLGSLADSAPCEYTIAVNG